MFDFFTSETERINRMVRMGAAKAITDERFIELEIQRFKESRRRREMLDGERYYSGRHDILSRQRTVIGESGEPEPVKNLPNNRIVDNQYRKMVNQKANYLVGQPVSFKADNAAYADALKQIFNKRFMRTLKNLTKDCINEGIGWLFACYSEDGEFTIKKLKACEIIPGWKDADHAVLEYAIRIYEVIAYEVGNGTVHQEKIVEKVEVYDDTGVHYFVLDGKNLVPEQEFFSYYFTMDEGNGETKGYNWLRIPLIPFRYNHDEIPLIRNVKSLQDGLNLILSNFQNNMEEDARNTILILVNYDGENLGEFRRNLATFGAVKVNTIDGAGGDVRTLQVEVNAENYKSIIEIFKKAIIENAMGYDAKDDRMGSNANQLNIMSMYSDIDLDADDMETEFQAGFEDLLWFVNCHLANNGYGDFEGQDVEVIFNRDILISESEAIDNCGKSAGILSDETIVANHPWVDDPQAELERLKKQKEENIEQYGGFPNGFGEGGDPLNGEQ